MAKVQLKLYSYSLIPHNKKKCLPEKLSDSTTFHQFELDIYSGAVGLFVFLLKPTGAMGISQIQDQFEKFYREQKIGLTFFFVDYCQIHEHLKFEKKIINSNFKLNKFEI